MRQYLSFFTLAILLVGLLPWQTAQAQDDYLNVVKDYADAMITHGRDRYGKQQSPLFASYLHRDPIALPTSVLPAVPGVRGRDRAHMSGNVQHDMELYLTLFKLSQLTGNPTYQQEATKALTWFFNNAQHPSTHLMAWGEHIGWDFRREQYTDQKFYVNTWQPYHEFFNNWELWPEVFSLTPKPAFDFAMGLWNHQIHNKTTGTFSRHANYFRHGTACCWEFMRHAGFYITTWTYAYHYSNNAAYKNTMIKAIETLINHYNGRFHPSGRISADAGENANQYWMGHQLGLIKDLADILPLLPPATQSKIQKFIDRSDEGVLSLPQDVPNKKGFLIRTTMNGNPTRYNTPYGAGYGVNTIADIAQLFLERYEQITAVGGNSAVASKYYQPAIQAANVYLNLLPDVSSEIQPAPLASVVDFLIKVYEVTQEKRYLDRANVLAKMMTQQFLDSRSPLPKVTNKKHFYETITGGDNMMWILLKLHELGKLPDPSPEPEPTTSLPQVGQTIWLQSRVTGQYVTVSNGLVYANSSNNTTASQHFEVTQAENGSVRLRSLATNRYVQAISGSPTSQLTAQGGTGSWTQWQLVDAQEQYIRLQSLVNTTHMMANNSAPNKAVTSNGGEGNWAQFSWGLVGIARSQAVPLKGAQAVREDQLVSNLRLYPNPTSGTLTVVGPEQAQQVSIHNSRGQLLLQAQLKQGQTQLDVSALPKGLYLVKVGEHSERILLE